MKKFLMSLFLIVLGVLFIDVKEASAMNELEVEAIIREYNLKEASIQSSGLSSVANYSSLLKENTYKVVQTTSGDYFFICNIKSLGDNRLGLSSNNCYYKIDHNKSLSSWVWSDEDITFYLDTYSPTLRSDLSGLPHIGVGTNPASYFSDDTAYFNNMEVSFKAKCKRTESIFKSKVFIGAYCLTKDYAEFQYGDGGIFRPTNMGKVTMVQGETAGRLSSCNQCAYDMLIQNSGLIKDSNIQCEGTIKSVFNQNEWVKYDNLYKSSGLASSTFETESKMINGVNVTGGTYANTTTKELEWFKKITDVEWNYIKSGGSLDDITYENSSDAIVRWGNKDLKDMTKEELLVMCTSFYNNDYFLIFGINDGDANGPKTENDEYRAGHVVLFAGCSKTEIFINDTTPGAVRSFTSDNSYAKSPLKWMIAIKCNDASTKSICKGGDISISDKQKEIAESLGVSPTVLEKTIESDKEIAAYCKLMESDLESVLDGVNRDNLTGDQLDSLKTWEDINADSSKKGGVLYWVRLIMMWLGIALVVWAVLLYVSFWFDRANNFIDISFVTVLTLGKLTTSETDEEYTFGDKNSKGIKTINSRILTKICVLSIVVGALIISGTLYTLIAKLVNFVMTLIAKGG